MSETAALSRRGFLKTGALAGTGLVIGLYLPGRGETASAAAATASFAPNAWLSIDPQGKVTIWVGKSEMGQGVRTSMPMLVAEELEVEWASVRIEQALADKDRYGDQGTGGSTSVRTSWEPLRKAGATAREMLREAAAQSWKVDKSSCRAEKGAVVHTASGRRLAYGALAAAAAKLPVPREVPLKDPKDFRILGQRLHRLDTPGKVDGSAQFGIDIRVPGMLYATVARCPVFGGKAAGHDESRAKAVKGVRHVVAIPSGVAVVADSTWAAMQGREALEVRWDEGPNAGLTSAAIRRQFEEAAQRGGAVARKEGDAGAALAGAARKLEAIYEVPFLSHAPMEPQNTTARVGKDLCEVWSPTQVPNSVQTECAKALGIPPASVKVHTTLMGGGFGRRLEEDYAVEAVQVAKAVGAPVKVVWTREDDMRHDWYRPASYHRLSAGLDGDGRPAAWTHRVVAPSIVGQRWPQAIKNGLDESAVDGAANLPYGIPHILVDYVMSNTPVPTGWWRAVYNTQNGFVNECFIDELAAASGKDPYEFRLGLLSEPRKVFQPGDDLPLVTARLKGVLELAASRAGWGKPLPKGRGRGLAAHFSFGSYVAEVAEISVAESGAVRVHRVVAAVDCGMTVNPDILEAQVQGGIVYGLTAALKGAITIDKGRVEQGNFDDYEVLRIEEMPEVEVHTVPSSEHPGGMGEPGVPPIAPAVANAVFAATGKRIRRLPIRPADLTA